MSGQPEEVIKELSLRVAWALFFSSDGSDRFIKIFERNVDRILLYYVMKKDKSFKKSLLSKCQMRA